MTAQEARKDICKEFISGYLEWLTDEKEMNDSDYSVKYGWGKAPEAHKECFASVKVYMEYFFCGRYLPGWEKAGYTREAIYALNHEGFLSYKFYGNWDARMRGKTEWYYISQRVARNIYNEYKASIME